MSQAKLKVIESNIMDKENRTKSLEAAVSLIEKNYGKGSIMKLGSKANVDIESISTGSLGLDIALGIGGVPKGRIVEIYGPESSGKTTLATHIVAESQKQGGNCAFIDVVFLKTDLDRSALWNMVLVSLLSLKLLPVKI